MMLSYRSRLMIVAAWIGIGIGTYSLFASSATVLGVLCITVIFSGIGWSSGQPLPIRVRLSDD